jgi:hypothetical protein
MSDEARDTTFDRVPKSKHRFLRGVVITAAFAVPVVTTAACHQPPGCVPGVPCQSPS